MDTGHYLQLPHVGVRPEQRISNLFGTVIANVMTGKREFIAIVRNRNLVAVVCTAGKLGAHVLVTARNDLYFLCKPVKVGEPTIA